MDLHEFKALFICLDNKSVNFNESSDNSVDKTTPSPTDCGKFILKSSSNNLIRRVSLIAGDGSSPVVSNWCRVDAGSPSNRSISKTSSFLETLSRLFKGSHWSSKTSARCSLQEGSCQESLGVQIELFNWTLWRFEQSPCVRCLFHS